MKNIFKILGVALIGSMMFTACDPEGGVVKYTITANSNNSNWGTVTGGGKYEAGETATLTATANAGYEFVNWSDGSTNNPLLVNVTEDATYTANFAEMNGVNVTFGTNTWRAGYVNALQQENRAILLACAQTTSTSLPQIRLQNVWETAISTGTVNGTSEVSTGVVFNGPKVWYYEVEDDFMTLTYQDETQENAGDWWDKSMTLNVTAFDADAATISLVANATMGKATELVEGVSWANATERSLTVNVANQTLTSAKGAIKVVNKGTISK